MHFIDFMLWKAVCFKRIGLFIVSQQLLKSTMAHVRLLLCVRFLWRAVQFSLSITFIPHGLQLSRWALFPFHHLNIIKGITQIHERLLIHSKAIIMVYPLYFAHETFSESLLHVIKGVLILTQFYSLSPLKESKLKRIFLFTWQLSFCVLRNLWYSFVLSEYVLMD